MACRLFPSYVPVSPGESVWLLTCCVCLLVLRQGVDSHTLLQQPLIYCHFAHDGVQPSYKPVKDWEVLRAILTEMLDSYNELNAAMHLVLFEDAMQHV